MNDSRPDGLSPRQRELLVWAAMLSPLVRQAPADMLAAEGGAWLSAALTVPALLLEGLVLGLLFRARRPGEGAGALFCRLLGPGPGRCLAGLCGVWLTFCGGFLLRAGADRMVSAVYPESPVWLFAAVMLSVCLPAGLGRARALGRCAEVTAPVLLAVLTLVLALAVPALDLSELRLPAARPAEAAARGALPLLGTIASAAFFALFPARAETPFPGRSLLRPQLALAGLGLALCVTVTGAFGPALAGQMDYPFFVLVRNVPLFRLLERVEALVAGVWVVSDYLLIGAVLQLAAGAAALAVRGPGTPRGSRAVWLCAAGMAAAAWLCAPDAFVLHDLGRRAVPAGGLLFAYGALPLALLVGRLRGQA